MNSTKIQYESLEKALWTIILVTYVLSLVEGLELVKIPFLEVKANPKVIFESLGIVIISVFIAAKFCWSFAGYDYNKVRSSVYRFRFLSIAAIIGLVITKPWSRVFSIQSMEWYYVVACIIIGYYIGKSICLIVMQLPNLTREKSEKELLGKRRNIVFIMVLSTLGISLVLLSAYLLITLTGISTFNENISLLTYLSLLIGMIFKKIQVDSSLTNNDGTRIKAFSDIHEYLSILRNNRKSLVNEIGDIKLLKPVEIQNKISMLSPSPNDRGIQYRFEILEPIDIRVRQSNGDTYKSFEVQITKNKAIKLKVYIEETSGAHSHIISLPLDLLRKELLNNSKSIDSEATNIQELISISIENSYLEYLKTIPENLFNACSSGNIDLVKLLVESINDINCKGIAGWSSLNIAAAQGHLEVVEYLLKYGADPDIPNDLGVTPIMFCARYGNSKIFKSLLKYVPEINKTDFEGNTALMVAIRFGSTRIAIRLIRVGCDLHVKNKIGLNALAFAHQYKNGAISKLIRGNNKKGS